MSGGTTASSHTEFQRVLGNTGRGLDLTGNVGFDSLPDQLVNKAVKKGFDFNILCIGETGIGKSTLMESLFKEQFNDQPVTHRLKTVSVNHKTYDFNEGNVRLKLTVVSTEGFGDQIDKEQSINSIVSYIDQQFERYLQEELKIKRDLVTYHDTRLHSCLYFLSPTGHSLKSLDLKCMKELDKKVNIIPIIAKADTIARSDLGDFKARIMEEIRQNDINIYQFPTADETVADLNRKMNNDIPFAVVGSSEEIEVNGKKIRARKYPWGTVEVENEAHCDFTKLREMLLRVNMEDLREATHSKHFEQYRRKRLEEMGFADDHGLSETYEEKRQEHIQEMQIREEKMRQMFVQKVKDKEAELKNAEQKLHDEFERLRRKNTEEKRELEDQKRSLDDDTKIFNQKKAALQAQRAQSEQNQLRSSGKKR